MVLDWTPVPLPTLKLTSILVVSPGNKMSFSGFAALQPQPGCTFLIIRFSLPSFLKTTDALSVGDTGFTSPQLYSSPPTITNLGWALRCMAMINKRDNTQRMCFII